MNRRSILHFAIVAGATGMFTIGVGMIVAGMSNPVIAHAAPAPPESRPIAQQAAAPKIVAMPAQVTRVVAAPPVTPVSTASDSKFTQLINELRATREQRDELLARVGDVEAQLQDRQALTAKINDLETRLAKHRATDKAMTQWLHSQGYRRQGESRMPVVRSNANQWRPVETFSSVPDEGCQNCNNYMQPTRFVRF